VCDRQRQDLVLVPGGNWIVATSFGGSGGIRIVNVKDKKSTLLSKEGAKEQLDKKTYDTCPGPRMLPTKQCSRRTALRFERAQFGSHRYVINHGKRESIEVFELDAKTSRLRFLDWLRGCAGSIGLNEVLPHRMAALSARTLSRPETRRRGLA
jgi:hypothetical protein